MAAGDRDRAISADIPGDDGKMCGRPRRVPALFRRRQRVGRLGREQVAQRNDAVGNVLSEAADKAELERLRRRLQSIIELIVSADAPTDDQRAGARATERSRYVGAPPQQWQRHRDHAGAQHRQKGQHALDAVGELQGDNRVRTQPGPVQPPGDGRDHVIGLRVTQRAGGKIGEPLAIGRIDQRNCIRTPFRRAAKQIVEGRASADARAGRFAVCLAEDQAAFLIAVGATRFRVRVRTGRSPREA
jgi:hypothetical protein